MKDNRKFLLDILKAYKAFDSNEEESRIRVIEFVKNNTECFENNHIPGHITGSAFVVDYDLQSTLLTHHIVIDKWFQFGGHSDGHFNPLETGLREANEESGLKSLKFMENHQGIFDLDVHPIPERKTMPEHFHYDIRILLQADKNEPYTVSSESKDLKWVDLKDIKTYSNQPAVWRMAEKALLVKEGKL